MSLNSENQSQLPEEHNPVPSTSTQMDHQAWMDPSAMEFLERIPVLIHPTASAQEFILTVLNIELDMKVDVIADKHEKKLGHIIAPLINIYNDYRSTGTLDFGVLKKLWTSFSVITAFGLNSGLRNGSKTVYKGEFSKGVKLHIESKKKIEINRENHWAQSFSYLCDGLRTEWKFQGTIVHTVINYPPLKVPLTMVNYLRTMGVNCKLGDDDVLVLII